MSHLCNHCTVEAMKLHANKVGHTFTFRPRPFGQFSGGVDLYVHPATYTPPDPSPSQPGDWWAGWFAAMPDGCHCYESDGGVE